jgi:hypothetical protein
MNCQLFEVDDEQLNSGLIYLKLFASDLWERQVDPFLEQHRTAIFKALPEEPKHHPAAGWGERKYLTFVLAFQARVFGHREVTEYLCSDPEYEYRLTFPPVVPIRTQNYKFNAVSLVLAATKGRLSQPSAQPSSTPFYHRDESIPVVKNEQGEILDGMIPRDPEQLEPTVRDALKLYMQDQAIPAVASHRRSRSL